MKIFFDTSVLVAALTELHPMNRIALPWLEKAAKGKIDAYMCSHSLAEVYSALTRLPISPRISPAEAGLIVNNIPEKKLARIIELKTADYWSAIQRVAELGLSGGVIYDALLVAAARRMKADRILTFNRKHFQRLAPLSNGFIVSP